MADELVANFSLNNTEFDALFEINANGAYWGAIQGELDNQLDLKDALDNLSGGIESNHQAIGEINTTINGYGDIVTYNVTDFATSAQGALADTALQPNDNISELTNDVGYITSASLPTVNNATITIQKNGSTVESFTLNQSNDETINLTIPTQTSDLTNNSGFITNLVNDLTNYYLKTDTYTKLEVQQLIASIPRFSVEVVSELPATGQPMTLYLVPKQGTAPDVYDEYVWITESESYELLGSTAVDLTGYIKNTATGSNSLTIMGTAATSSGAINIGSGATSSSSGYSISMGYSAKGTGASSVALGRGASSSGNTSVAIGRDASSTGAFAIQLGKGTNSTGSTFAVGFNGTNYQMLDGSTGLIPDARISSNIARTSAIPTVDQTYDGTSTNAQSGTAVAGAISTKQNTLTAGNNITISGDTISATDTTYTAGTGIDITNGVISNTQTSAEWGNITGTLANQTDLIAALNLKQDLLTSDNAGTDISIASGSGEAETVSGTGSVELELAVDDGLNSVTLTGGTVLDMDTIPDTYTRIEYLEATGTQYIDSGIAPNFANNKIKQTATVQYTTSNSSRELMGTNGYGFWGKNASNKIEAALGSVTVTDDALVKNVISWTTNPDGNALELKVNNNTYTSTASSFVDADYAYYVFALGIRVGSGAAASFFCHAKVWDYTIEVDDEVVCHLIPVKRISDNVLGMYDTVTGTFKTNAGTGTFTGGSDVVLPSPSNPVDLITNNGAITVSPNLFRTLGSTTTQGGVTFSPQPDGSVICSGTANAYYSYYLGRADFDPGTIDKITVAINGTFNASGNIVVDKFHVYSGSTSLGTISYTNWTQSLTVDIANDYPTADNIRVYLKRNSNTTTNAVIQPMAVKGSTNKSWKPYGKIYINGTTETVSDGNGNTATAENLLALPDYADTQELLTGAVNRQIAILAITGLENWTGSTSNNYFSLAKSAITPTPTDSSCAPLCTHLIGANTYTNTAGTIYFGTSYLNLNYNNQGGTSSSANMIAFRNWLKSQYANGTPVILIYPLDTATTETVTAQTLTTIEGDNTLTITQASINNLPISANYDKQGTTLISFTNDTGYITSASVGTLTDVSLDNLSNGQGLLYNSTTQKWENATISGGGGTVDQTYDGTSANAQSGVAIAGAGFLTSSSISNMQTTSNLVTSVSSSSTDSQYPSAKLFYDTCGDIETLINAL